MTVRCATAEDLDALPEDSVIRCTLFVAARTGDWWFRVGTFYPLNSENLIRKAEGRTITVLFNPDTQQQTETP